ncbi:MAG: hypothetical protein K8U57_08625 [Planctomycetes bacterium]|nr:hypothetical protein [Planctomycetota bacterium]
MPSNDDDHLKQAKVHWECGRSVEAGRLIYENLPATIRPAWAAKILKLVLDKSGADRSHFERVLNTAENPRLWANGHRCFDILRDESLKCDTLRRGGRLTNDQEIFPYLLTLAEFVAKVTYNAVDPPDEFDEDCGWWVAVSLRGFVDLWKDEAFSKAAWSALNYVRP